MSEYMERHTVSRLIGAPPGYVGFDQGGLLTEAVQASARVLLLDEIEKAHPDVFNLLLQVMDHGTLTDNNGRKADFRHVIIVMTTNAGAADMAGPSIGFTSRTTHRRHGGDQADVQRRSSATASTRSSSLAAGTATIERVVDKLLMEARGPARGRRACSVDRRCGARWIADKGYDPKMGARPMARVIQEQIKRPLAEELLFGNLAKGGHVRVAAGALSLVTTPATRSLEHMPDPA
jgi:ATP-dependent Clp protease ATP-binding subunit ClpA